MLPVGAAGAWEMIDLKGLNMNLVRLLAQARVVGEKELTGLVNYAHAIARLARDNPGDVFPQPIEETLGLWQAVALLASVSVPKTCEGCRYAWHDPGVRLARTPEEAARRMCVVDPPSGEPKFCHYDRPACSRWEPKG